MTQTNDLTYEERLKEILLDTFSSDEKTKLYRNFLYSKIKMSSSFNINTLSLALMHEKASTAFGWEPTDLNSANFEMYNNLLENYPFKDNSLKKAVGRYIWCTWEVSYYRSLSYSKVDCTYRMLCAYCNEQIYYNNPKSIVANSSPPTSVQMDHIIPRLSHEAKSLTQIILLNSIYNLTPSCKSCNNIKSDFVPLTYFSFPSCDPERINLINKIKVNIKDNNIFNWVRANSKKDIWNKLFPLEISLDDFFTAKTIDSRVIKFHLRRGDISNEDVNNFLNILEDSDGHWNYSDIGFEPHQ